MSLRYPLIAQRVFGTPLLMHPGKAHAAARAIAPRLLGVPTVEIDGADAVHHRPQAGSLGDRIRVNHQRYQRDEPPPILHRDGPVAVIPIEGTLVHKGEWIGASSGMTSYEGICAQLAEAREDDDVKAVVLEVDSFGGEVSGAFDCADTIADLAARKPTIAILADNACSAGYLIAAGATTIIAAATGYVGSIGVITMHEDISGMLADEGVKITIIAAGARKADGNPFEALPKDVYERTLAECELLRDGFAEAVGRYRGKRLTKDAALATEAGAYLGPEALRLGLVDAVARPSVAYGEFRAAIEGRT